MIWNMIDWLLSFVFSGFVFEVFAYFIIDRSFKDKLQIAKNSSEKRNVFLDECVIISFISFLTWFHHVPYFFLTMIFCTLSTLAMTGRNNLRLSFRWLLDCYKEFREHEESLNKLKQNQSQVNAVNFPQVPITASQGNVHPMFNSSTKVQMRISKVNNDHKENEIVPPPNITLVKSTNNCFNGVARFAPDIVSSHSSYPSVSRNNDMVTTSSTQLSNPTQTNPSKKSSSMSILSPSTWISSLYSNVHRRPPLHGNLFKPDNIINENLNVKKFNNERISQNKICLPVLQNQTNHLNILTKNNLLSSKIQPHIQLNAMFQPRGLINNKENLCFFNCIIQVLARTNKLVTELIRISGHLKKEDPLLSEVITIFASLTNPDLHLNNSQTLPQKPTPVDTTKLRKYLLSSYFQNKNDFNNQGKALKSIMMSNIIPTPDMHDGVCPLQMPGSGQQMEQDVAEMFMWLLERLNQVLVTMPEARDFRMKSEYHKMDMNLWTIYGNPRLSLFDQLKEFHQQQLRPQGNVFKLSTKQHERALSDLDWLLYKQPWNVLANNSHGYPTILDDLFTGQLIFTTFCNHCRNVSVMTDIFKILPVHVPQNLGTGVSIEQCLQQLTFVDHISNSTKTCKYCTCAFTSSVQPNYHQNVHHETERIISSSPKSDRMTPDFGSQSILNFLSPIRKECNNGINHLETSPITQTFQTFPSCDRQTLVTRLPDYLVIQLMKFQVKPPSIASKLLTRVKLSSLPLNIQSLVMRDGGSGSNNNVGSDGMGGMNHHHHQLYAVILHSSRNDKISDGHYKVLVKTNKTTWHMFDDEHVTCIDNIEDCLQQSFVQQNAYLLFYSKLGMMN